ncbi:hypothetical protein Tco_0532848 [Tanacetum coccineum]
MAYPCLHSPKTTKETCSIRRLTALTLSDRYPTYHETPFDQVRYGSKIIDDTTLKRRYYEWIAQNTEFDDDDIPKETINKSIRNEVLNEWVSDSFDVKVDFRKMRDDPYSTRFKEYKEEFDKKIK